jgi:hypothetical protein
MTGVNGETEPWRIPITSGCDQPGVDPITRRMGWAFNPDTEDGWTAIGGDTYIRYYTQGDDNHHVGVGIIEFHKTPTGEWCGGSILFDIPENAAYVGAPMWTVVSREPLHLEPSLLCTSCGHHGFIRNGVWVNA